MPVTTVKRSVSGSGFTKPKICGRFEAMVKIQRKGNEKLKGQLQEGQNVLKKRESKGAASRRTQHAKEVSQWPHSQKENWGVEESNSHGAQRTRIAHVMGSHAGHSTFIQMNDNFGHNAVEVRSYGQTDIEILN